MKNWRKIICVALSLFVVGTQMLFEVRYVSAKNVEETENEDETLTNENSDYSLAINVVSALGIINVDDDDFHENETLSRAKAAEIAVKFLKIEDNIKPYQHFFSDVEETHWASGCIELCCAYGFVNGMGDGTFKPDENVSYQQMVKMIVCMTGWDSFALEYGGWIDGGYIYAAKEAGIIQNSLVDINRPITYGEVAKMLYKALEINIRDETCSQQIINKTIRELVWKLERIEGIIECLNKNSVVVLVTDNSDNIKSLYQTGEKYAFTVSDKNSDLFVGDQIFAYATEENELMVVIRS